MKNISKQQWISLSIKSNQKDDIDFLYTNFHHDIIGTFEKDDQLIFYFDYKLKKAVSNINNSSFIIDDIEYDNWHQSYEKYFKPIKIDKHTTVIPDWHNTEDHSIDYIRIKPGMAFGTGHHPTTRMCLEELSRQELTGKSIVDIGSGSGILSIAAVKLGALSCIGIDIDENAIDSALNNIEMNGVSENITLQTGVLDDLDSTFKYDVIVANITAQIIINLVPSIGSYLKPNGIVITSGILSELFPEVENTFNQLGFQCSSIINSGDWSLGVFSIT